MVQYRRPPSEVLTEIALRYGSGRGENDLQLLTLDQVAFMGLPAARLPQDFRYNEEAAVNAADTPELLQAFSLPPQQELNDVLHKVMAVRFPASLAESQPLLRGSTAYNAYYSFCLNCTESDNSIEKKYFPTVPIRI